MLFFSTPGSIEGERSRLGRGSHILTLVRKFLNEPENWKEVDAKKCYQFPGVFTKTCTQQLCYIADSSKLSQTCDDVHFMWKDIQLSKGQLNKKRLIFADIAGKKEEIYYSSAPCLGLKVCPPQRL